MRASRAGVGFFQRRPDGARHFSIETVFEAVRSELSPGLPYATHVPPWPSSGVARRLAIAWWCSARRHQVNHITGDIHFVAFLLPRKGLVLTVHDCASLHRLKGWKRSVYRFFWFDVPLRRSEVVTTISEATARDLRRLLPSCSSKLRIVPNPVHGRFRFSPGVSTGRPRVLQVGTAENKNLDRLIRALEGLDVELDIVGLLTDGLRGRLADCRIRYVNSVGLDFEALRCKYEGATLVTFVSTFEGFGLPILEAQAVGRPLVVSDMDPLREVAGGAAVLVDPLSVSSIRVGVERLLNDEQLRRRLVAAGRTNVAQYTAKAVAGQYEALYGELLAL